MLIVDMPMPISCTKCPMVGKDHFGQWRCNAYGGRIIRKVNFETERPSWCPIKGELVTCGECRYPLKKGTPVGTVKYDCVLHKGWYDADHYCGHGERHGERKDGEDV